MLTKFKSNRLGEILVRKGIISREQLKAAIHEQHLRKKFLHPQHSTIRQSTCLGEILTELGFIDRAQLKRGLNWQLILRKMAMVLALCAPLFGAGNNAHAAVSTKTILNVPATIQAEDFLSASGVKNVLTADIGGGAITGSINAGDWMNYVNKQVNIPTAGYYIISYRVSSLYGGGSFIFTNIANKVTTIDTIAVPKTGSWLTWTTLQRKVYLKAGPHYFGIQVLKGGFNFNWFKIASASTSTASSTSSASKSSLSSSQPIIVSSSKSSASSNKSSAATTSKATVSSSSKVAVSSSSKAAVASSSKSSLASSKSSAASTDSLYTHVEGTVGLTWIAPKYRENKTILDITELGGYQLRYKLLTDKAFTYVTISDPWTNSYNFSWLEGDYIFQIAAFDKLGVVSDFANFTN